VKYLSIIPRSVRSVLLRYGFSLPAIVSHKLVKGLVSALFNYQKLVRVPNFVERFDVAMEIVVILLVKYSALGTNKSSEGNVCVSASVVLTVNAEGIKLVLVDFQVEVGSLLG